MDEFELRKELMLRANKKHRIFLEKSVKTPSPILGIKMDVLKDLTEQILKTYNCDDEQVLNNYFKLNHLIFRDYLYFEEQMMAALLISSIFTNMVKALEKKDLPIITACSLSIPYLSFFVEKIDNWATCDAFANHFDIVRKEPLFFDDTFWRLNLREVFIARFVLAINTYHFIHLDNKNNYIPRLKTVTIKDCKEMDETRYIDWLAFPDFFRLVMLIPAEGYSVDMAKAWFLTEAFCTRPCSTINYLKNDQRNLLSPRPVIATKSVLKKTLKKINESKIPTNAVKEYVKNVLKSKIDYNQRGQHEKLYPYY